MAEKIQLLISQPQKAREMGKEGRKFVEKNYDIHQLNDELHKIYSRLLSRESNLVGEQ